MAGGFLGKLILTFIVIYLVWRGFRLWGEYQARLARAETRRATADRPGTKTLDLAPCPSCGTYVPRGAVCATCGHRMA